MSYKHRRLYHNYLFVMGFLYYLIFPAIIGQCKLLGHYPGMDTFYNYFPNDRDITIYYFLCIVLLISFFSGSYFAKICKKKNIQVPDSPRRINNVNWLIMFLLICLNQLTIISNSHLLFTGYTEGYHVSVLGELSTMNCFFLFVFLYCKVMNSNSRLRKLTGFLVLENSFVLLGFGSRMFVLIPFIAYLVYLFDNNIINMKKLGLLFCCFALLCLVVGVVRGGSSVSLDALLYIGFAEPLYTWVTAGSYIIKNDITLINYPSNFLGHFLNIVPSVIFPEKTKYIPELNTLIEYVSPFGATSLVPKFYGNFGLFLAPFVAFIGSFLLTVIRYSHNKYMNTLYYCCCGMIPFLLFRDLRSVNKLLFASFCIYPIILIQIRFPSLKDVYYKKGK